jgi:hypothetical protein
MKMSATFTHGKVLEALQAAAQQYGMKRLAADLNKAPGTLYNELNPFGGDRAKLGLEDAVKIMQLTGSHDALRLICGGLGHDPHPVCGEPVAESGAYEQLASVVTGVGRLADGLKDFLEDGKLDKAERLALFELAVSIHDQLAPFMAGEQK